MLVGNNYKIEADSLNVTLYKRSASKKAKTERWRAISFFSRFGGALKALIDLRVKETELKDFRAVCKKQDELYKLIDGLQISKRGVNEKATEGN